MVLIPLSGKLAAGRCAIVDDQFADELMQYRWHCASDGYARRCVHYRTMDNRRRMHAIWMHREVLRLANIEIHKGYETDHINGNPLDNRLENLRVVTVSQNHANSKSRGGTSRYKGLCWHKRDRKWMAYIKPKGKRMYLGYFTDEIDAAKAYDAAAREYFGQYACCNFPIEKKSNRFEG